MTEQADSLTSFPDGRATTPGGLVVTVKDVPEKRRFEAWVGQEFVGYAGYRKWDEIVIVMSTVIEAAWREQGIASTMTEAMLAVIRDARWTVGPRCPFTADYLARHEDQLDLVDKRYHDFVKPAFRPGS